MNCFGGGSAYGTSQFPGATRGTSVSTERNRRNLVTATLVEGGERRGDRTGDAVRSVGGDAFVASWPPSFTRRFQACSNEVL